MQYTYLLVNFLTVIVCFAFSFHPKVRFDKQFPAFLKASILVGIPFIIWDILFTEYGIWWFNTDYTLGVSLAGLPLEEWLFFICIPFACVFTYFCIDKYFQLTRLEDYNRTIVFASVTICMLTALLFFEKTYTFVTALTTIGVLIYLYVIANVKWIGKASFTYLVLMLGFFPVNGVLTGTGLESPVVNYNPDEFLGIRMGTIPIEDAVYGYILFLLNLHFFKMFQKTRESGGKNP